MTARTPAQLKTNMPSGTPGGTTIADMHDFIDTMDARTTFSVKEFGALGTVDSQSTAAADTAAFVAATAAAAALPNGAGAVYVPSGFYHINPNTWAIPSRVKVFGDGYSSKIRKNGDGWLLDISGTGNWAAGTQTRNSYCILRDLQFDGRDNDDCILRIIYGSEVLIDKCRFSFNNGPAIDAVEWWDSRVQNCFFDWCGDATWPSVRLRNNSTATVDALGYSEDSTNAIYFYGCRFESFKNGAFQLDQGPFNDPSPVSQVFLTNCKCETTFLAGSIIQFLSAAKATNVHIDTLFLAVNNVDTGYVTSTNLIDWSVNSACSIRNVFATVNSAAASVFRSVVRSNVSSGNCTIENIWVQSTAPTLAVVDFQTGTANNLRLQGWIGGQLNSLNASPLAKNGGGVTALTANYPTSGQEYRMFADDGLTYTNSTATNITVTLPLKLYAGWRVRALQLSTGTITFAAASGGTITVETSGHLPKTGAANSMIEVWCYENSSTLAAPKFYVTGKTSAT